MHPFDREGSLAAPQTPQPPVHIGEHGQQGPSPCHASSVDENRRYMCVHCSTTAMLVVTHKGQSVELLARRTALRCRDDQSWGGVNHMLVRFRILASQSSAPISKPPKCCCSRERPPRAGRSEGQSVCVHTAGGAVGEWRHALHITGAGEAHSRCLRGGAGRGH